MISMKLSPAEAKSETMLSEASEAPQYPYGLTICIDDEIMARLGMTELPEVGTALYLQAKVEVCSTSQYQNQDGADKSLSLQITDMDLSSADAAPRSNEAIANSLYGSSGS